MSIDLEAEVIERLEGNVDAVKRERRDETEISKLELISRKIACRSISIIPDNLLKKEGDNIESVVRKYTDEIAGYIFNILDAHHDDITEYLMYKMAFNTQFEILHKEGSDEGNQVLPDDLNLYMKEKLLEWRNQV